SPVGSQTACAVTTCSFSGTPRVSLYGSVGGDERPESVYCSRVLSLNRGVLRADGVLEGHLLRAEFMACGAAGGDRCPGLGMWSPPRYSAPGADTHVVMLSIKHHVHVQPG